MLEGLAAWVLNNYLGKYVENLNTDQLSIALLSGKVELENLPLKKDALRHLGLPIEIKAGFIGKVKLQIPVRQVRSAPWVIAIEQLYFVASPLPVDEWDAESEELAAQELKLAALDDIEAKWRLENEARESSSAYYASSYSSWLNFGAGLVSDIVENLQLKIVDVHIRYEDSSSILGKSVAFGITMESLSAQSCDSTWAPGFSHYDKGTESFKILQMQKLAVYWIDLGAEQLLSKLGLGDLAVAMSPATTSKHIRHYILAPVSASAHVKRNRSEQPLRSADTPRLVCDLHMEEVPLTLVDWQYDQLVKCIKGLDTIDRLRSYRHYKPPCSVKEDARAWWLYAISCFYPGRQPAICRPKPTLELCRLRATQNVNYVQVYTKILSTPNVTLTPEEKKIKDEVEWNREFEDLKVLREIAMRTAIFPDRNSANGNSAGRSMLVRWFPQWMGWYSSVPSESAEVSPETTQLEGEILQVLTDSAENNTILKRDVVFGQFNFCLKRGCLTLCASQEHSEDSAPMLELEFKNLSLNIISKPRTSSHLIELSLGSLFLKDKITLNTLFPVIMGPPGFERTSHTRAQVPSPRPSVATRLEEGNDQLFYVAYEKKPQSSGCDYRLCIRSKCLDVVYQPNAVNWLTEFLCLPHQRDITHSRIEAMKSRTKKELIKNWEQILDGNVVARSTWDLEFDISAPQIIFVEQFTDNNSAMAVIDFGRFQLTNHPEKLEQCVNNKSDFITKESEEDETFLTPCSTPPQSEASDSEEHTLELLPNLEPDMKSSFTEKLLHHRLYDRYSVELTDLQILIGKVKDNWRYAHNKGSSTLHVLDRFNISLQIEKRMVHTSDPLYPSLVINTNLPKLVAHLNESKITSARNLAHIITVTGLPSPFKSCENPAEDFIDIRENEEESFSIDTSIEMSRLLMIQFTVDQLSLEVQSRGRCVAELQVAGVKVAFTKRPHDMTVTLSVHSLLLVDALQTFGPDFELLVASHKHVGMDSMSGSLRDSEPTSPTSPSSPDSTLGRASGTSPVALKQALSSLATSPPLSFISGLPRATPVIDSEALITIEVIIVTGQEPLQIANIQFNNLDIIANQETLVELIGFTQRVFPKSQKSSGLNLSSMVPSSVRESTESLLDESSKSKIASTQLTFDFHRLNVLLLRGVVKDGILYGKKICTATMSDAKIQATVGSKVEVEGSLGGLQVLDLTPEGQMHQRIISVGRDPLLETMHPLYTMSLPQEDDRTAFNFRVVRSLDDTSDKDVADVTVRMASLWYTHSPQFVMELQSCASEFKQYLSNLARSIRSAATDMALGLVHARAEALAQSLYMNARLSSSLYGSALSFSESSSPRRRRRSSSMEPSGYSSARDTVPHTPYSPADEENFVIDLKLDVELDSPVLVLPQASNSPKVFVAHLGIISVNNKYDPDFEIKGHDIEFMESRIEHYFIEVRDMNVYSVDTSNRRVPGPMISKPEVLYNCKSSAKPILHDTILHLKIEREIYKSGPVTHNSESSLLFDDSDAINHNFSENFQIKGTVVNDLKVSLTRSQYEQLLETIQWLTSTPTITDVQGVSRTNIKPVHPLTDIREEDTGVTTLNMDPHVRAKLFPTVQTTKFKTTPRNTVSVRVLFELPLFTIELRGDSPTGEQGLVDLSFRDFVLNYEKCHLYETNIQVSLRSIFMEDLLQPENSKQRAMVVSSAGNETSLGFACVSRSCPDVSYHPHFYSPSNGSLPDHLETGRVFGMKMPAKTQEPFVDSACPCTPPPSPNQGRIRAEQNLVLISTLLVDPSAPNFNTTYKSIQRSTSVDFNCLDLVISVESWVVVIDFFSASASSSSRAQSVSTSVHASEDQQNVSKKEKTETNITVRSLTLVLVRPDIEVAKANISNVHISVKTSGLFKEVQGKLGSMSLLDLTLHGQLYRERFITTGKHALQFQYTRDSGNKSLNYDAQLSLEMSSVMFVHTKRFVAELQAFLNHFTQLQSVMKSIRAATSGQMIRDEPLKLCLVLKAVSPIILLPVSSKSTDVLVADLGRLLVTNSFKFSGDPDTISPISNLAAKRCMLDVMIIELDNMDLYTGVKENELTAEKPVRPEFFKLGSTQITKTGPSLLKKKIQLKLQVERNLSNNVSHNVPDMSIYGQLSTLDGALDLPQYRLIRGLLAFNLGEDTERILPSVTPPPVNADPNIRDVWTLSSLKLDLHNVNLCLQVSSNSAPLTCINFIKSRLTVETYSNFSQDIDLISQEILIMDTRFDDVPADQKLNIFKNILQPIKYSKQDNLVQAEIHSRKRQDRFKYTILLNNMRLMAIFNWWEAVQKYIFQEIENISSSPEHQNTMTLPNKKNDDVPFELKLNITDSEIVVVQDAALWDSNSVILKTTTVVTYKPSDIEKPLSCSLNNCEVFSCILGMEDETALSIIDPVTLNMDINKDNVLEAQLQFLTVRLSYRDMRMFVDMLNSLPQQLFSHKESDKQENSSLKNQIVKLKTLGFKSEDCIKALEISEHNLDDAALWLTQNASLSYNSADSNDKSLKIKSVEIKANCISICIIDDCGDSDVPLLELSFNQVNLCQLLPEINAADVYPQGFLECVLVSDYYNRVLSGWEPFVEPWRCKLSWEKSLTKDLRRDRLNLKAESATVLNINITSTLIELYKQVKENWIKDYYNDNSNKDNLNENSPGFRRRSPFVPFALKNDTGSILYFTTLISELNHFKTISDYNANENWILVAPGETTPFSFRNRAKMRHHDSHKMKMHQLGVKVEGWQPVNPVTVDKVGVYFRTTHAQIQNRAINDVPSARIVFDISLEGSARKLITVRSGLLIINKLPHSIEVKLESQLPHDSVTIWAANKTFNVQSGNTLAVPLVHAHSLITARPAGFSYSYTFCSPSLSWAHVNNFLDPLFELRTCHSHKGYVYRFCAQLIKDIYSFERSIHMGQPAHRIVLVPALKLCNLLPVDVGYSVSGDNGRVIAGATSAITNVDLDRATELDVTIENFKSNSKIVIPAGCNLDFKCRINLEDERGRKLLLAAVVSPNTGAKIKITISASYWIINKTGLPLVFRQGGTSHESSGQFEEHEIARMVSPLLFSFSDQEASPTINARVGKHVIRDASPQWCSNFHVQKGIQVKKLHVTMCDGKPDTVFIVGVEVRPGRGKYRSTSIITISPRYQLYNQSSYKLIFTQSCFATNLSDPKSQKTCLNVMPNSHVPFHWPRLDKDKFLCVSIQDIPDCCWSGGLKIDEINSLHVNVRDSLGRVYFVRLEVLLQGATFFVIFTDADTLPPPIRVDNFSEVAVKFAQTSCKDFTHSNARAHSSVPYAWDQPTEKQFLTVIAPGGVSENYNLNRLGKACGLTYENFIYIAFAGTFKNGQDVLDPLDVESQELVLDVIKNNQVILSRKRQGQRSQLWRMTAEGRLQHEGSSPPSHPNQPTKSDNMLVLDIENTAPQPNVYSRLMLRRIDPRRKSTQTWRFTDDGRLCCAHYNMCVQAQDGFFGLRQGNSAVLGLPQPICHKMTDKGIPIEQAISRQRLRPGSGILTVNITMDGPTRVLSIKDLKEKRIYATPDEREWGNIALKQRPILADDYHDNEEYSGELQVTVVLAGLGISVVCRKAPEELLYALFSQIVGETVFTSTSRQFCISVGDIQIDNQLFETPVPVVLYVTPPSSRNNDEFSQKLPAIEFTAELQQKKSINASIFEYLIVRLKKITIILEEKLLLKVFDFIGYHSREEELINKDENDYEVQRLLLEVSTAHSKRYYFGVIQLILGQIQLSVNTATKLPSHLLKIKRKLGLTLIKFENAAVDLQAFDRRHLFETGQFLINSIIKHFKDELLWQAGVILVSVDFLGNPLGFVNDVSEGVSGLIFEGNFGALVKNVTHGISNSAVKVTESISDGLGRAVLDDHHEEVRQKIRQVESGKSRDHIVAGFKGLGFGLLGGATGLFKQVYEGASNDGFPGVISGIGKGLVGAVTKPVVGMLDFASETARAVRDSSRSKAIPERIRLPRCVSGAGGLLPRYSSKQSQGQQYLYIVNDKDYKEQLMAYEVLGSASEDLLCIVSNLKLRIVASTHGPDLTSVIECHLSDLEICSVMTEREGSESRYYIEIIMHVTGTSAALVNPDPVKKPRVRCKSLDLAKSVSQQINYAKRLYIERLYTLSSDNTINSED